MTTHSRSAESTSRAERKVFHLMRRNAEDPDAYLDVEWKGEASFGCDAKRSVTSVEVNGAPVDWWYDAGRIYFPLLEPITSLKVNNVEMVPEW